MRIATFEVYGLHGWAMGGVTRAGFATQTEALVDAFKRYPDAELDASTWGDHVANCAIRQLAPGTMGSVSRRSDYIDFLAPMFHASYPIDQRPEKVTSCGMFVGGVDCLAGRPRKTLCKPDDATAILGYWAEGRTYWNKGWVHNAPGRTPPRGAMLYWEYSLQTNGGDGHVEIVTEVVDADHVMNAAGGGSLYPNRNGSVCRLSAKPKSIRSKDSRNRVCLGWVDSNIIAPAGWQSSTPAAPPPAEPQENIDTMPDTQPGFTIRFGDRDAKGDTNGPVHRWQRRLQDRAKSLGIPNPLPRFGADGDFGSETLSATRQVALDNCRVVDSYLWNLAEPKK